MKAAPLAKVVVDERERPSGIPGILARLGDNVVFKLLDVGDYVISEDLVVERKTSRDLVRSLFDGRLFDQARRLVEAYGRAVVLVQGSPEDLRDLTGRQASVYGSLARLLLEEGMSVVYVADEEEAALLIHSLAEKEQGRGSYPVVHRKPRLGSLEEWQLYVVQSLPHVGPKLASRLLRSFGSVLAVFNASPSELSRIEGISEWKAQEIVRILRAPYRPSRPHRDASPS